MTVDPRVPVGPVREAPGGFVPVVEQRQILVEALAGVELGVWDERIVDWLSGWDACTVLTVVSWIVRARESGPLR